MELVTKIEAVLFYKGEAVRIDELMRICDASSESIDAALSTLSDSLQSRALRVIRTEDEVVLATAPELAHFLDVVRKDELSRDIGKAGAETLAIILYRGAQTRNDIDYIRGVNSSFILRNLMMRGLVSRSENPKDGRTYVYTVTSELLAHMGVTTRSALPGYTEILEKLEQYEREQRECTDRQIASSNV
jgi:segregation and condensation protein B